MWHYLPELLDSLPSSPSLPERAAESSPLEAKATPEFTDDEVRYAYESVRWPIDPPPVGVVE